MNHIRDTHNDSTNRLSSKGARDRELCRHVNLTSFCPDKGAGNSARQEHLTLQRKCFMEELIRHHTPVTLSQTRDYKSIWLQVNVLLLNNLRKLMFPKFKAFLESVPSQDPLVQRFLFLTTAFVPKKIVLKSSCPYS